MTVAQRGNAGIVARSCERQVLAARLKPQSSFQDSGAARADHFPSTDVLGYAQPPPVGLPAAGRRLEAGAKCVKRRNARLPKGWGRFDFSPVTGGEGYRVTVERKDAHGGKYSARITHFGNQDGVGRDFGRLTQTISPEKFRGKRARLSGVLRVQDVSRGFTGLWMQIDCPEPGKRLGFENMASRESAVHRIGRSTRSPSTCLKKLYPSRSGRC